MNRYEIRSPKLETNPKPTNGAARGYDLEARTFKFAKDVRNFVLKLPRNVVSIEDSKQLVRSSGSVGANYLEANESLSKKDFLMRIKISKKEARESIFWLELLQVPVVNSIEHERILKEAGELVKILGAILRNSS